MFLSVARLNEKILCLILIKRGFLTHSRQILLSCQMVLIGQQALLKSSLVRQEVHAAHHPAAGYRIARGFSKILARCASKVSTNASAKSRLNSIIVVDDLIQLLLCGRMHGDRLHSDKERGPNDALKVWLECSEEIHRRRRVQLFHPGSPSLGHQFRHPRRPRQLLRFRHLQPAGRTPCQDHATGRSARRGGAL